MADKAGFLVKEGGRWKNWKKRWFVLKNNVIYYSKKQNSGELGIIRLNGVKSNEVCVSNRKGKKNCWEIRTANRTYFMCAETESEMLSWVDCIKRSIDGKQASTGSKKIGVQDFELLHVIGKGSFGKVLQVRKKDNNKIYAMKILNKKNILENNELEHTKTEKNILQKLVHPFLVNLNYSFQTIDKIYFIMDYVNGGELFYHLQKEHKFEPNRVRFYCAEIVLGLEYLHNSGVIYRDLKPENILLNGDGHICLTDFGISKEGLLASDSRTETFCGTPEYLAPEVLEGKGYNKAVDWWSFGTLMYEMLTGLPPFYSQDVQQMYFKIMHAKLELPSSFDADTKDILLKLLVRDPANRLAEPDAIKNHPYFKSISWEKLIQKEIEPPFKPQVTGDDDTSQVDPAFLNEPVSINDPSDVAGKLSQEAQKKFENFTFNPEDREGEEEDA